MTSILEGVIQRGTGVSLKSIARPLAGKTGTTNESKDTWFIGFSPDLVVGVFVGFDDPRSMGKRETGASTAAPIFGDFIKESLKDKPIIPFRIPAGIRNIRVNADTGARAQAGDKNIIWEAFTEGTQPGDSPRILGAQATSPQPSSSYTNPAEIAPENPATMIDNGTGGLY
jgi:penicillin-binding protein 1A